MSELNQREAFAALENKVNSHLGSNGEKAHLPADIDRSGFMTPEHILNLDKLNEEMPRALGNRVKIADGTDILTLPPGHYAGANLINSTLAQGDGSLLMIDVTKLDDTHVQIRELVSAIGEEYFRVIHNDNKGSWGVIRRYVKLFEGYIGDEGTEFTLAEPIENYAYMRVLVDNGASHQMVHEVRIEADTAITDTNAFSYSGVGFTISKMIISLSGTSGRITRNVAMTAINSTNTEAESAMKLKRIEGVK